MPRDLERGARARAKRRGTASGSRRTLDSAQGARVVVDGRELVAFASNDYLGLANHPDVVAAARDGAARWGVGAGASHLVCGHFAPHAALEAELAAFVAPCAGARALTFSSGYLANLAILTALAGRGDAIFADRLNHACLNDGALLSRADLVRYLNLSIKSWLQKLCSQDFFSPLKVNPGCAGVCKERKGLFKNSGLALRKDLLYFITTNFFLASIAVILYSTAVISTTCIILLE